MPPDPLILTDIVHQSPRNLDPPLSIADHNYAKLNLKTKKITTKDIVGKESFKEDMRNAPTFEDVENVTYAYQQHMME